MENLIIRNEEQYATKNNATAAHDFCEDGKYTNSIHAAFMLRFGAADSLHVGVSGSARRVLGLARRAPLTPKIILKVFFNIRPHIVINDVP